MESSYHRLASQASGPLSPNNPDGGGAVGGFNRAIAPRASSADIGDASAAGAVVSALSRGALGVGGCGVGGVGGGVGGGGGGAASHSHHSRGHHAALHDAQLILGTTTAQQGGSVGGLCGRFSSAHPPSVVGVGAASSHPPGHPPGGPQHHPHSSSNNFLERTERRKGKWTVEEEAYVKCLIAEFERGTLADCDNGTTQRDYLQKKLHCANKMRISKKFPGRKNDINYDGKRVYVAKSPMGDDDRSALHALEMAFYRSISGGGGSGVGGEHSLVLPPHPANAAAHATAAAGSQPFSRLAPSNHHLLYHRPHPPPLMQRPVWMQHANNVPVMPGSATAGITPVPIPNQQSKSERVVSSHTPYSDAMKGGGGGGGGAVIPRSAAEVENSRSPLQQTTSSSNTATGSAGSDCPKQAGADGQSSSVAEGGEGTMTVTGGGEAHTESAAANVGGGSDRQISSDQQIYRDVAGLISAVMPSIGSGGTGNVPSIGSVNVVGRGECHPIPEPEGSDRDKAADKAVDKPPALCEDPPSRAEGPHSTQGPHVAIEPEPSNQQHQQGCGVGLFSSPSPGLPKPALFGLPSVSDISSSRSDGPLSAEEYALLAQQSVVAVSQHSAYCQGEPDIVPLTTGGGGQKRSAAHIVGEKADGRGHSRPRWDGWSSCPPYVVSGSERSSDGMVTESESTAALTAADCSSSDNGSER